MYREGDEVSSEGEMNTLDALISDAAALISTVEQKLQNGEFQGDDYVLTEDDKQDIASNVLERLPAWKGGSY